MLEQLPQHAHGTAPDRQGVGTPEQDLSRSIKAEGAERVDDIHAETGLNQCPDS